MRVKSNTTDDFPLILIYCINLNGLMAILILRNLFISFLNAEIRSNIFIRKWEISMFYLALFGLFLFAGRIGETVRVRDGGGVKGGGGGGDRLGGVPAHQLGGGQRWGRFRGAHSRAGGWILLLQGVSLFSLIYIILVTDQLFSKMLLQLTSVDFQYADGRGQFVLVWDRTRLGDRSLS